MWKIIWHKRKLDSKSKDCILMGYEPNEYRVYEPPHIMNHNGEWWQYKEIFFFNTLENDNNQEDITDDVFQMLESQEFVNMSKIEPVTENADLEEHELQMVGVPTNYREAVINDNSKEWKEAMDSEYSSLIENQTWELAELPNGKKAIKCRCAYALKKNVNGKIINFKARLVAQGYSQVKGIDYQETFSPVVTYTSIRYLLSVAAVLNLNWQMDAVTAFLNGELKEEIYMEEPEGYQTKEGKFCKLKKNQFID